MTLVKLFNSGSCLAKEIRPHHSLTAEMRHQVLESQRLGCSRKIPVIDACSVFVHRHFNMKSSPPLYKINREVSWEDIRAAIQIACGRGKINPEPYQFHRQNGMEKAGLAACGGLQLPRWDVTFFCSASGTTKLGAMVGYHIHRGTSLVCA